MVLDEQGLYQRSPLGGTDRGTRWVAANVDAAESDLGRLDPQELVLAISAGASSGTAAQAAASVTAEQLEGRQRLWWMLLVAALLCLGAETVLSNRLPSAAR